MKKKRKATDNNFKQIESRMDEAYNILKKASIEEAPDKCSLYAALLAKKLRDFDENTCELAMHEIDNYLFHLKFKNTQPNFTQPSPTSSSNSLLPEYSIPLPFSETSSSNSNLSQKNVGPSEVDKTSSNLQDIFRNYL